MKNKKISSCRKQLELINSKGDRKLKQDLHKPMVIEDKKKKQSKNNCRRRYYE